MEDLLKNTDNLKLSHRDADLTMYINIDGMILIRITDLCSMTVYRGYAEEEEYEQGDAGIALTKEMAIQLRDKLDMFINKISGDAEPARTAQTIN